MEEVMIQFRKEASETLSDVMKRGFLMKGLANESELQKHIVRNTSRLTSHQKMRDGFGSRGCSIRFEGRRPGGQWIPGEDR